MPDTSTPDPSASSDVGGKFKNIALIFLGILIFMLHLVIYWYNKHFFNIFLAVYIILFGGLVLYYVYDEKSKSSETSKRSFDIISYAAIYTMFLYTFIMILSLVGYIRSSN